MKKFRTVAVFTYPAEASVIKSKLESENVSVFLRNEFTVAAEPFASNALGGIKMEVYREDYLKALAIIEKYSPEVSQRIIAHIICPQCGKRSVREQQDVLSAQGFSQIMRAVRYSILPFIKHKSFKCTNCAYEFDINE